MTTFKFKWSFPAYPQLPVPFSRGLQLIQEHSHFTLAFSSFLFVTSFQDPKYEANIDGDSPMC
jgi:hypothetical protein